MASSIYFGNICDTRLITIPDIYHEFADIFFCIFWAFNRFTKCAYETITQMIERRREKKCRFFKSPPMIMHDHDDE